MSLGRSYANALGQNHTCSYGISELAAVSESMVGNSLAFLQVTSAFSAIEGCAMSPYLVPISIRKTSLPSLFLLLSSLHSQPEAPQQYDDVLKRLVLQ